MPQGTRVLFKEPSVWDRYKVYILGAAACCWRRSLLIAGLLLQRRRRRQAEDQVRGNEEALRTATSASAISARGCSRPRTPNVRASPANCTTTSASRSPCSRSISSCCGPPRGQRPKVSRRGSGPCTETIARGVHNLAYRLYPATLRVSGWFPLFRRSSARWNGRSSS